MGGVERWGRGEGVRGGQGKEIATANLAWGSAALKRRGEKGDKAKEFLVTLLFSFTGSDPRVVRWYHICLHSHAVMVWHVVKCSQLWRQPDLPPHSSNSSAFNFPSLRQVTPLSSSSFVVKQGT